MSIARRRNPAAGRMRKTRRGRVHPNASGIQAGRLSLALLPRLSSARPPDAPGWLSDEVSRCNTPPRAAGQMCSFSTPNEIRPALFYINKTFPAVISLSSPCHTPTHATVLCGQFASRPQESSCTTHHTHTQTDAVVSLSFTVLSWKGLKTNLHKIPGKGNCGEWI